MFWNCKIWGAQHVTRCKAYVGEKIVSWLDISYHGCINSSRVHWIYKLREWTLAYSLRSYCDERIKLPH